MLRAFVLLLVLGNLGFYAWSHGYLRAAGLGPTDVAEPQRLKQQIHPERLTVSVAQAAASALAAASAASAPSARPAPAASMASAAQAAVTAAASAPAGAASRLCLQLGPYITVGPAVGAALRAAGLTPVEKKQALNPQWMVLMGPFPDTATLNRKLGELQRLGLKDGTYTPVTDRPNYMPGISLGVLGTEAAAQQELAQMQAKGVNSAQVVQRNAGMKSTFWVLDGLTPAQAATLRKLSAAALKDKKPEACAG
ncbi:MAG: sporulation protein [Thiomonas sp.]